MINYWAVGACYNGTDDKSEVFINDGVWIDGYGEEGNDKYSKILSEIKIGDVLILKSKGVKNRQVPFTRVKAIGVVKQKIKHYEFSVKWKCDKNFPIDFGTILYMDTISKLRDDKLLCM